MLFCTPTLRYTQKLQPLQGHSVSIGTIFGISFDIAKDAVQTQVAWILSILEYAVCPFQVVKTGYRVFFVQHSMYSILIAGLFGLSYMFFSHILDIFAK